jgi:hypothetical protein
MVKVDWKTLSTALILTDAAAIQATAEDNELLIGEARIVQQLESHPSILADGIRRDGQGRHRTPHERPLQTRAIPRRERRRRIIVS